MRSCALFLIPVVVALAFIPAVSAEKKGKKSLPVTLDHDMKTITGKTINLAEAYAGKVVLIVNVASECGATPQYKDLQTLYEKYKDKGFVVLGMPCNQFGGQEPGSDAEIKKFCEAKYAVTFPMFSKIDVKGKKQASLYKVITSKDHCPSDAGDVGWNFEKFLLGRDGKVVARYRTGVNPGNEKVSKAVESALEK